MTTLMQHPKHGKHPATGHEIEHMKANGWTICPPKVKEVEPAPAQPEQQGDDHLRNIKVALASEMPPARRTRGPNKQKA